MKIRYKIIINFILFLVLTSCNLANNNERTITKTDFIKNFINENSQLIFNSEMERIKVNFFPESASLIYTIKNREKVNQNGAFFLQMYPKDSSCLPDNRRKYKFLNLSINNSEIFKTDSTQSFLLKKLRFPYKVKAVRTGQFTPKNKSWQVFYTNDSLLTLSKKRDVGQKEKILNLFKQTGNKKHIKNLGLKVFSNGKTKTEIYYNVNKNRLIGYWGNNSSKESVMSSFFIKGTSSESLKVNDLVKNKNKTLAVKYLEIGKNKKVVIGQKQKDSLIWHKEMDINKYVFNTYPPSFSSNNFKELNPSKKEEELINFLLLNTLKLIYYDKEDNISFYSNFNNSKIYAKVKNLKNKASFDLKSSKKDTLFYLKKQLHINLSTKQKIFVIDIPQNLKQKPLSLIYKKNSSPL